MPKTELPSEEQRISKLFTKARPGNDYENLIVNYYLPFAERLVAPLMARIPSHGLEIKAAAGVGLVHAVRAYKGSKGSSFRTYASRRIKGEASDYLRSIDWLPRSARALKKKIERTSDALEMDLGRSPTDSEVAKEMDMSIRFFQQAKRDTAVHFTSLDAPITVGNNFMDGLPVEDVIPDPYALSPLECLIRKERIELCVTCLVKHVHARYMEVLDAYTIRGLKLHEIAEKLGLTESRICQIYGEARKEARSILRKYNLADEAQSVSVRETAKLF